MAKQLNLLGTGQVIPTALHTEMERSYLEYAMSVIVGRALPDVRDGLKPVHRRILYAMHELGLTPDRPFRKCARIVGDVLGKYHPHGDQAVYDALVRMVQTFSSRYPLLDGHGNFGSVDNDPPAAMRYTECRLAAVGNEGLLREISEATVDFIDNFDNSQQEPVVLPAQLPILLLNGCAGIAVGMATNVPPHNLGEIVDGLMALIDNPELADEQLWALIPGPDFPTGGEIVDRDGIREAYRTGRGLIAVRGVVGVEQVQSGGRRNREKTALVVTELPFQVNKAGWIEKVAELVNNGRLEGIADLRDESDREGMRVVIELKRDAVPEKVLGQLYQQTPLQSNFGAIMLALVDNRPCQLSLRELLTEFLAFREQTLRRQYHHELESAQQRLHLLSGLLIALNDLDTVIEILRHAADGTTAKANLQERLGISEGQADSILSMPLRRLTGLERQKLQEEHGEVQQRIEELQRLLGDRHELLKALKKELRGLKRKFADERRTKFTTPLAAAAPAPKSKSPAPELPPALPLMLDSPPTVPTEAEVVVTYENRIGWQIPTQKREARPEIPQDEDFPVQHQPIAGRETLMAIADFGKAYPLSVATLPGLGTQEPPSIVSLLPKSAQKEGAKPVFCGFLPENSDFELILLSEQGRIKRLAGSEFTELSNRGLTAVKLKDGDRVQQVSFAKVGQQVAIATTGGRVLRFALSDSQLPVMGRNAQGTQALRLRTEEQIVGLACHNPEDELVLVSQLGYGKRLTAKELRLANRGDIGTQAFKFSEKQDNLASMLLAAPSLVLLTNQGRRWLLPLSTIPLVDKDSCGDRLIPLKPEESVTAVVSLD